MRGNLWRPKRRGARWCAVPCRATFASVCRRICGIGLLVGLSACAPAVANNTPAAAGGPRVASEPEAEPQPELERQPAPAPDEVRPLPLPRGPANGPIGTEHPIYVSAAAYDGSWMIACQARVDTDGDGTTATRTDAFEWTGDALTPYLVLGSGTGMALPGVGQSQGMLISPKRHFIAFAHERGVAVLDTKAATVRGLPRLAHPKRALLAFSPDERYLVGRFESADGPTLQIYGLTDGTQWDAKVGPGEIGPLWFDAGAADAWVDVTRDDTNGDGRLASSHRHTTLRHPCSRPAMLGMLGSKVDTPVAHRVPLVPDSAAVAAPGALMSLGGDVVARTPDAALERRGASSSETIADARCGADIVWVSATADAIVYRCDDTGKLTKVDRDGKRTPMGGSKRALHENVRAGREWVLLDYATAWRPTDNRRVKLGGFRRAAFTSHSAAVVDRAGWWVHHRLEDKGRSRKLAQVDAWRWFGPVEGRFVLCDDAQVRTFDAETGAELGRNSGHFWSLRTDGQVLVGPPANGKVLPLGPLRWVEPS